MADANLTQVTKPRVKRNSYRSLIYILVSVKVSAQSIINIVVNVNITSIINTNQLKKN